MHWSTKGFDLTKQFFEQVLRQAQDKPSSGGGLAHAYLFTGQEMIGKRTFALELAGVINDCKEQSNYNSDVLVVSTDNSENEGSIAIGDIRKAKSFLSLSPNVGPYKFVIVDNADQMTAEAQNAFLKVLEEASESSIIILVTAFKDVLLPTIISRCQEMQFPGHSAEEIKQVLIQEKVGEAKAEFLSKFVNGKLGLALKIARENLFEQLKAYLAEFAKIKKEPLNARLKLAQTLAEEEKIPELKEKILYWMLYLHMQARFNLDQNLDQPKFQGSTLKNLMDLNYNLGQPQFNRRLMIENFMTRL